MRLLIANGEKCTGCRTCTFVCSFAHYQVFYPTVSRIRIIKEEERGINVPVICEHCNKPPCIPVCPVKAIRKDVKTGIVCIDANVCTGCKACVEACPYSAIVVDPNRNVALICDLCGGDPMCAKYCEPGVLEWVEWTNEEKERKWMLTEKRRAKLREVT